jgi:hypothetical protein
MMQRLLYARDDEEPIVGVLSLTARYLALGLDACRVVVGSNEFEDVDLN